MSSYLAFDPEAVAWLGLVTDQVADELDAAVSADPAALDARARARRAAATLREWGPLLRRIAACIALDHYRPVDPTGGLDAAIWTQLGVGRVLVTDSGRGPFDGVDPNAVAAALGDALRLQGVSRFGSPTDLADLRQRLQVIAGSPSSSATFLAHLGTDAFADLATRLARPWTDQGWALLTGPADPGLTASIDLLGTILGRFRANPTVDGRAKGEWAAALDDLDPLLQVRLAGAGALIPGAWTDAAVRALVVDALGEIDLFPGIDTDPNGYLAGSQALTLLSRYPVECQRFLAEADEQLVRLALEAFDPSARQAVLLASADPRRFTPDEVGPAMLRVIALLSGGSGLYEAPVGENGEPVALPPGVSGAGVLTVPSRTFPPGLGVYLAPYLPEVLGLPGMRPGGISWQLSGTLDRTELLALIGTYDPAALATLAATTTAVWEATSPTGPATTLAQVAEAVALVSQVRSSLGVQTLQAQRSGLDFVTGLGGNLPVVGEVFDLVGDGITGPILDAAGFDTDEAAASADFDRGMLAGVLTAEALARWAHASGVTPPPPFMPPADDDAESGADPVIALDHWVRSDADFVAWLAGLDPARAAEVDEIVLAVRAGAGVDYVAGG